jgi:hypothetical protein
MIRNEGEYQEAVKRLKEERARHNQHEQELVRMGLKADEVKRAMDPLRSFHLQLDEEAEAYERNEYQGITVERASRILDALGVTLKSAFETPVSRTLA